MAQNKEDLLCPFCEADIRGTEQLLFHVNFCHSHEDPAILYEINQSLKEWIRGNNESNTVVKLRFSKKINKFEKISHLF